MKRRWTEGDQEVLPPSLAHLLWARPSSSGGRMDPDFWARVWAGWNVWMRDIKPCSDVSPNLLDSQMPDLWVNSLRIGLEIWSD